MIAWMLETDAAKETAAAQQRPLLLHFSNPT